MCLFAGTGFRGRGWYAACMIVCSVPWSMIGVVRAGYRSNPFGGHRIVYTHILDYGVPCRLTVLKEGNTGYYAREAEVLL